MYDHLCMMNARPVERQISHHVKGAVHSPPAKMYSMAVRIDSRRQCALRVVGVPSERLVLITRTCGPAGPGLRGAHSPGAKPDKIHVFI